MGWTDRVTGILPEEVMLPAVGRGPSRFGAEKDDQDA